MKRLAKSHVTMGGVVAALAMALLAAAPASAQQAKCLAGKTGCMAKKTAGLLKCEALAETPGKPADPDAKGCVTKVKAKFDGGLEPAKGCFEKLESKTSNDCITVDDTAAAETAVDGCVASVVAAIDPPPLDQTKCGAGKKKCVSTYLTALLKCRKLAQTPGMPADPNTKGCVDKAVAKYTGGADLTKGCFAKLEAKDPNDCQHPNDSAALQALAGNCVDAFVAVVTATPSTTSTTLGTTTSTTISTTSTTLTSTTSTSASATTSTSTSTTSTSTSTTTSTTSPQFACPLVSRCGTSCCARGQVCEAGACMAPTCNLTTKPCAPPATCIGGHCVTPCGPVGCSPGAGSDLCCSPGPSSGICCNGDTQVCSATQTSCVTQQCGAGQVFVPAIAGCCGTQNVCGTYGNGVAADCCIFGLERCDPDTVTCVPR